MIWCTFLYWLVTFVEILNLLKTNTGLKKKERKRNALSYTVIRIEKITRFLWNKTRDRYGWFAPNIKTRSLSRDAMSIRSWLSRFAIWHALLLSWSFTIIIILSLSLLLPLLIVLLSILSFKKKRNYDIFKIIIIIMPIPLNVMIEIIIFLWVVQIVDWAQLSCLMLSAGSCELELRQRALSSCLGWPGNDIGGMIVWVVYSKLTVW